MARLIGLGLVLAAAAGLAACGGDDDDGDDAGSDSTEQADEPTEAPAGAAIEVLIEDFDFQPRSIALAVGDTVTFTQGGDAEAHTATAEDGSFDTGLLEEEGASVDVTFDTAGRITYICELHPGMVGIVTVTE